MTGLSIKGYDIIVDEERLKSMEVAMERRRGRGDRKWSLLFNYPDGNEEYRIFDSYREAAEVLYMASVLMEQNARKN